MDSFELCADLLSTWKDFPRKDAFIVALRQWCGDDPKKADWLVTQRDQFDKYPGPATLKEMIATNFHPTGPNARYQPPVQPPQFGLCKLCKLCQGWGCIQVNGVWQHCNCRDGLDLKVRVPGYVEFCNTLKNKPKTDGLRHVSETVADVIAGKQTMAARRQRQPGED